MNQTGYQTGYANAAKEVQRDVGAVQQEVNAATKRLEELSVILSGLESVLEPGLRPEGPGIDHRGELSPTPEPVRGPLLRQLITNNHTLGVLIDRMQQITARVEL